MLRNLRKTFTKHERARLLFDNSVEIRHLDGDLVAAAPRRTCQNLRGPARGLAEKGEQL